MAGAKIAFLVAACLVAGLVLGDAAPMKCKAKARVTRAFGQRRTDPDTLPATRLSARVTLDVLPTGPLMPC